MADKMKIPGRAEEARINRGIARDPDNPELTDEQFSKARPARELLPHVVAYAEKRRRGQRGAQRAPTKKAIALRVDPDVLAKYKAAGRGWQKLMNEALNRGTRDL